MNSKKNTLEKNQYYDAVVEGLSHDGLGVTRPEGITVFATNALPGEHITMKTTLVKKNYAFAKTTGWLQKSPHRLEPPCPIYDSCGGCQLQHLDYEGQLEMKRELVAGNLKRIGHLENIEVLPVLGMKDPWRYRNKSQVPFARQGGEVVAGFYKKRTHEIIDMKACLIQPEAADHIIQEMRELCETLSIPPYDEQAHTGFLRHVVVRVGFHTGEIMVTLVTRTAKFPQAQAVITELNKKFPAIKSIAQNINPAKTNVIFGEDTKILFGEPYIYDELDGLRFAISPRSFYQVNPLQTEVLYKKAVEFAGLTGTETVFDAYCGIGTITLFLARHAKTVYGVEIVPEAIADAKLNADLNGVGNAVFEVGTSETVIPTWIKNGIKPDVIVVDPPRKGCDPTLLETIIQAAPARLVYVSCDSSTLARDLRILVDGGFTMETIQPVDMFSQTTHVECVALMSRKK